MIKNVWWSVGTYQPFIPQHRLWFTKQIKVIHKANLTAKSALTFLSLNQKHGQRFERTKEGAGTTKKCQRTWKVGGRTKGSRREDQVSFESKQFLPFFNLTSVRFFVLVSSALLNSFSLSWIGKMRQPLCVRCVVRHSW